MNWSFRARVSVKTPFIVSFGGVYPEQSRRAQDKLLTTDGVVSKLGAYPFALSTVEGLRQSLHTVWRSEKSFFVFIPHLLLQLRDIIL
jgi:hypothetical protein